MLRFFIHSLLVVSVFVSSASCKKKKSDDSSNGQIAPESIGDSSLQEITSGWQVSYPYFQIGAAQGSSQSFALTLNPSDEPQVDIEVTATEFSDSQFSFNGGTFPGANGTCDNSLSESCRLDITYTPQGFTTASANLSIATNKGYISVPIAGTSVQFIGTDIQGRQPGLERGLNRPFGVFADGTHFMIADSRNDRVLIYNSTPSSNYAEPNVVVGKLDLTSGSNHNANERSLGSPYKAIVVGSKLIAADTGRGRVVIWNSIPTENGVAADVVLGKDVFNDGSDNYGGLSASSLSDPTDVASDGTRLAVADSHNNRVLIWNTIPTTDGQAADFVLGQPDFTSNDDNNGGVSASSLSDPQAVDFGDNKIYVADTKNNRVLIWTSALTSNGQAANLVLGQPNFTDNTSHNGGPSHASLNQPKAVTFASNQLFIADTSAHRIKIYNSIPTINQQAADYVIGQPDGSTVSFNSSGLNSSSMYSPLDLAFDGTRLIVADSFNNRVLIWNSLPAADGVAADLVVGQELTSSMTANAPTGGANGYLLSEPYGLALDQGKLYAADKGGGRVLVWNSYPTSPTDSADLIIGKNALNESRRDSTTSASNMIGPDFIQRYEGKTIVSDPTHNRILIWNNELSSNGQSADLAIGQADLTSSGANNGGISASTVNAPGNTHVSGAKFFVADSGNNRVLIWNTFPVSSGQAADVVLGQPDFVTRSINTGGRSASSLNNPHSVIVNEGKLIVSDRLNNRILIWNSVPTTHQAAADIIVGQETSTQNDITRPRSKRILPGCLAVYNNALYAVDLAAERIMIWNSIPTENDQTVDRVIGLRDIETSPSWDSLRPTRLYETGCIAVDQSGIYVSDRSVGRILKFPHSTQP